MVALVCVAAVWGASFVIMKPAISQEPFWDFLATRFTIAAVLMALLRPRIVRRIRGRMLSRGLLLGFLLAGGYVTQTIALEQTTAAITGFLTGLYVVLTPLLGWLLLRGTMNGKVIVGSVLALIGLGFVSITGFSVEWGQLWGILCAVLFALHFIFLGRWSPQLDSYTLTVMQLGVVALVCWIGALPDGYQPPPSGDVWFAVVFTAVLATAVAFFVQTWAQSRIEASRVAVVLTLEVVFSAVFAVLVGQEPFLWKTFLGGAIIVAAMLVVEWPARKNNVTTSVDPMVH